MRAKWNIPSLLKASAVRQQQALGGCVDNGIGDWWSTFKQIFAGATAGPVKVAQVLVPPPITAAAGAALAPPYATSADCPEGFWNSAEQFGCRAGTAVVQGGYGASGKVFCNTCCAPNHYANTAGFRTRCVASGGTVIADPVLDNADRRTFNPKGGSNCAACVKDGAPMVLGAGGMFVSGAITATATFDQPRPCPWGWADRRDAKDYCVSRNAYPQYHPSAEINYCSNCIECPAGYKVASSAIPNPPGWQDNVFDLRQPYGLMNDQRISAVVEFDAVCPPGFHSEFATSGAPCYRCVPNRAAIREAAESGKASGGTSVNLAVSPNAGTSGLGSISPRRRNCH